MSKLELGSNLDVVEKHTYKVIKDTTGVLDFPTYEVWCSQNNRRRVVFCDEHLGWIPLTVEMCKTYYSIAKEEKRAERIAKFKTQSYQRNSVYDSTKFKIQSYQRNGVYEIDRILPLLKDAEKSSDKEYITLDGVQVKTTSQRYMVFKESLVCYKCGLVGKFFAAEKLKNDPIDKYHFNLYGVMDDGQEMLFTRDHVIPLSKGGSKELKNQKTMCLVCGYRKYM